MFLYVRRVKSTFANVFPTLNNSSTSNEQGPWYHNSLQIMVRVYATTLSAANHLYKVAT